MRLFIISLLMLFALPVVNAQISANISGLQIGNTELADGVRLLKSIDDDSFYFESNNQVLVSAHNFLFAGVNWSNVIATFEKGILVKIQMDTDGLMPEKSLNIFEKLNSAFESKYKDCLVHTLTDSSYNAYSYKDNYVSVLLSYDITNKTTGLSYTFIYKPQVGEGV